MSSVRRVPQDWLVDFDASPRRVRRVVSAAVAAIAVIAVVDYLTGPLLSLSILYLVPTAWASAQLGRRVGLVLVGVSAAARTAAVAGNGVNQHDRVVYAWNVVAMFITLAVVVELVTRLRQQAFVARTAEQQSREFLASAAHQLRTPLAAIGSTVDALILGGDNDVDREELMTNLTRETQRAGAQVKSLLRVARLDQREPVRFRRVELTSLLQREIERAAAVCSHVTWELSPRERCFEVRCNPAAVSEAVANLLDNASRHAVSRVDVLVTPAGSQLEISVRDDGPGLRPGQADVAFDRFVSLDGRGGSGLGLPIARGIAEAHGGTLTYCENAFVIALPLR